MITLQSDATPRPDEIPYRIDCGPSAFALPGPARVPPVVATTSKRKADSLEQRDFSREKSRMPVRPNTLNPCPGKAPPPAIPAQKTGGQYFFRKLIESGRSIILKVNHRHSQRIPQLHPNYV